MKQSPEEGPIGLKENISTDLWEAIRNDSSLMAELRMIQAQSTHLLERTKQVLIWRSKLVDEFPYLKELEGTFKSKMGKRCYQGNIGMFGANDERTILDEAQIIVQVDNNDEVPREIHMLTYSRQDYPPLGVTQGIMVRSHNDPTTYKWSSPNMPEQWTEAILPHNPLFDRVVGMSLLGAVGPLTEYGNHIKTIYDSYSQQKSRNVVTK